MAMSVRTVLIWGASIALALAGAWAFQSVAGALLGGSALLIRKAQGKRAQAKAERLQRQADEAARRHADAQERIGHRSAKGRVELRSWIDQEEGES